MKVSKDAVLPLSLGAVAAATALYTAYSAFKPSAPIKKKVILVTGASSGMGKDFALALLKEGHIVYGAARRIDRMKEIEEAGGRALACDVTNAEQVMVVVGTILEEQKTIDVLINNAGYAIYGAVEDITDAEAKRQFDVNLFGLAEVTKAVLPAMRKAQSGQIINISSMGGKIYTPFGAWYHATKHAVEGFSDCLRIELNPFGIQVVIVEPGAIETEFAGVVRDPCLERSKNSPYEPYVKKGFAAFEAFESNMSPPSVISDAIVSIVKSKKPKRRYLLGASAKPMVFIRNWFGDGFYDAMLLSMLK